MKVIIDRFEEDYAIVEIDLNKLVKVPKELFLNAKEGDVFNIEKDIDETKARKDAILELMNDLFID